MFKINARRLSSMLIFSVMFLTTCSASTAQPLLEPSTAATLLPQPEVSLAETAEGTPDTSLEATAVITPTAYLPFISRVTGKFVGIYLDEYWTDESVNNSLPPLDSATGKKHTSVGWFIDLEDPAFSVPIFNLPGNSLYSQLEALWNAGYISFINMGSSATAAQINNGERDREIGYAAEFYKAWVDQGGGRRALIAPLQEMNGVWTAYGNNSTSDELKIAFRRITDIFAQKGVTREQVWWVFAPNGYNDADKPERMFENYYPGDDIIDVIGFSSYNYGYCIEYPETYWRWESYPEIFEPYIARMQVMAPTKPIIIAETASTAYYYDAEGNPVIDYNQMSQWMVENYDYFAAREHVAGVFYFSFREYDGFNCEVEIDPDGQVLSGYVTGVSNPVYRYYNSFDLDLLLENLR